MLMLEAQRVIASCSHSLGIVLYIGVVSPYSRSLNPSVVLTSWAFTCKRASVNFPIFTC